MKRLALGLIGLFLATAAYAQEVVYYHTDALGSPVAVTDASGSVIERNEYEPYGGLVNRFAVDGPALAGHEYDAEMGLIYMQQRYYDPELGLFISVDPAEGLANRYWYANGNPFRFTDPDGRQARDRRSACWWGPANCGGTSQTSNNPPDRSVPRGFGALSRNGEPTPKGRPPGPYKDWYVFPKRIGGPASLRMDRGPGFWYVTGFWNQPNFAVSYGLAAGIGFTGSLPIDGQNTFGGCLMCEGANASFDFTVIKIAHIHPVVPASEIAKISYGVDLHAVVGFGIELGMSDGEESFSLAVGAGMGEIFKGISVEEEVK